MAHIWFKDARHQWTIAPLDKEQVELPAQYCNDIRDGTDEAGDTPGPSPDRSTLRLRRQIVGEREVWTLLAGQNAAVRLNGDPLLLGMAVLRDRDALLVPAPEGGGQRFFFSTEKLAQVQPFPKSSAACCPRCKQNIDPDSPAVQCPLCGVWHHQRPGKECWCYAERCGACQKQLTSLDAGYRWTPQDL